MTNIDFIKSQNLESYIISLCGGRLEGKGRVKNINPCPICNHKNHFKIYADTNTYKSFSCGSGGSIIDFQMNKFNQDKAQAIKSLEEHFNITSDMVKQVSVPKPPNKKEIIRPVIDYSPLIEKWSSQVSETDYFKKRGLTIKTVRKFNLGYSSEGVSKEESSQFKIGYDGDKPPKSLYAYSLTKLLIPITNNFIILGKEFLKEGDKAKYINQGDVDLLNKDYILNAEIHTVFITEGYFDAVSVEQLGYKAISLNSSNNYKRLLEPIKANLEAHKDKTYILLPDNDEEGKRLAKRLTDEFKELNISFFIREIPKEIGKDANDFLVKDAEGFKIFLEDAAKIKIDDPKVELKSKVDSKVEKQKRKLERTERLKNNVINYGDWWIDEDKLQSPILAKYLIAKNKLMHLNRYFYIYDKGYYKALDDEEIDRIINKCLGDYAQSKHVKEVKFQLPIIEIEGQTISRKQEELEQFNNIITTKNCNLVINGIGEIETTKHTETIYNTVKINAEYNKNSKCEKWLEFLSEALPQNNVKALQEIMGYMLTRENRIKKAFFFYGKGDCGKSVIINIITGLLGRRNISNIAFEHLNDRFKLSNIKDKLLNAVADIGNSDLGDSAIFKILTSGGLDDLTLEEKHKKPYSYRPMAKMLYSCNKMPTCTKDKSEAFLNRIFILNFNEPKPKDQLNKKLTDELFKELDGIFIWALEGLKRVISNGWNITETEEVLKARNTYKGENNNVVAFIDECCVIEGCNKIFSKELYNAYRDWCIDNGVKAVANKNFKSYLIEDTTVIYKDRLKMKNSVSNGYEGISLINLAEETPKKVEKLFR